jgi:multicomponent Na+:H+ antiporter subunit D
MNLVPFFVIIPLTGAFLIPLFGKRMKIFGELVSVTAALSLFILSIFTIFRVSAQKVLIHNVGGWAAPVGISMVVDGLSVFMLITVNLIAFLVAVFSVNYIKKYTDTWKFYSLFLLMLSGMNAVLIAGDLFNLYIFLEVAAIAAYSLVAFGTGSVELEASFKYAVMGIVGSSFILLGIAVLYSYTSTLNMADMALGIANSGGAKIIPFVSVLFLMGFGLKAALVPFHAWLPDAHTSAPTPISAMLSGVLIKVLGIYSLLRIFFNILGVDDKILSILMFLGTVSILVGVILAVGQWDFKRLLAYHSISQIGYVMLGVGLGTPLGIFGGLFHLFNHSIFKSLLFLNSGAVDYSVGTRDLHEMGGLKEKMPVTANTNLIASMSIAGIPPLNGFFSKLIIILACIQANHFGYAFLAVLGSLLTLASFMKVQRYAFSGSLNKKWQNAKEVPIAMRLAMIVLAIICVTGGLLAMPAFAYFIRSAAEVLMRGADYANSIMGVIK